MKTKKLIRLIESHGGVEVRQKGSHKMFKVAGRTITIPYSGSHVDANKAMQKRIRDIVSGTLKPPVPGQRR